MKMGNVVKHESPKPKAPVSKKTGGTAGGKNHDLSYNPSAAAKSLDSQPCPKC